MGIAEKIFVALDFENAIEMDHFLDRVKNQIRSVKVGMQLFYAEGPPLITHLRTRGFTIFLDLKIHDIPNTASQAVLQLAKLGVHLLTVHAAGGSAMMHAIREILGYGSVSEHRNFGWGHGNFGWGHGNFGWGHGTPCLYDEGMGVPKILAVTQLTSISSSIQNNELRVPGTISDQVLHLTKLAYDAGMNGVIASGLELNELRKQFPEPFLIVTPGVRMNPSDKQDQIRVVTPKEAFRSGASAIVIGRELTKSNNPELFFHQLTQHLEAS